MTFVTCVFAVLLTGILLLTWKDIYSAIPRFEQLKEARANQFKADIAREVWNPVQYSIEFRDDSGKRYQMSGVEKAALEQIQAGLSGEVPVVIRYGPWRSVFRTTKIFTVYQLEVGQQVVIPYTRLATARQREQSAGPLIVLTTVVVAGLAVFIALRSHMNFQRSLVSKRV